MGPPGRRYVSAAGESREETTSKTPPDDNRGRRAEEQTLAAIVTRSRERAHLQQLLTALFRSTPVRGNCDKRRGLREHEVYWVDCKHVCGKSRAASSLVKNETGRLNPPWQSRQDRQRLRHDPDAAYIMRHRCTKVSESQLSGAVLVLQGLQGNQ